MHRLVKAPRSLIQGFDRSTTEGTDPPIRNILERVETSRFLDQEQAFILAAYAVRRVRLQARPDANSLVRSLALYGDLALKTGRIRRANRTFQEAMQICVADPVVSSATRADLFCLAGIAEVRQRGTTALLDRGILAQRLEESWPNQRSTIGAEALYEKGLALKDSDEGRSCLAEVLAWAPPSSKAQPAARFVSVNALLDLLLLWYWPTALLSSTPSPTTGSRSGLGRPSVARSVALARVRWKSAVGQHCQTMLRWLWALLLGKMRLIGPKQELLGRVMRELCEPGQAESKLLCTLDLALCFYNNGQAARARSLLSDLKVKELQEMDVGELLVERLRRFQLLRTQWSDQASAWK